MSDGAGTSDGGDGPPDGPPGDGWTRVAATDDVPPGQIKAVGAKGARIVLANVDGSFYALEDRCSHQDFPLSSGELEGCELECAFHGATFDVRTGRATRLPAVRPVRAYDAELVDGEVYLRLA